MEMSTQDQVMVAILLGILLIIGLKYFLPWIFGVNKIVDSLKKNEDVRQKVLDNYHKEAGKKLERCENCGRMIGKLEQVYVWKDHIICEQCNTYLKK